jgi:Amidohydrolase family
MKHLFFVVALSFLSFGQTAPPVAIRNAKIVTVSGPTLAKGNVVLRNGLIEAVGENVAIPPDALIVEGEGLTVYPGLIDALSNWGMPASMAPPARPGQAQIIGPVVSGGLPAPPTRPAQGPEDRPATTSWIKAADELQVSDRRLETARNAGFTGAVSFPMRGIFAGQGAVINLAGEKAREMVLLPSVGQYLTLNPSGNGFPAALFGTISYIRQIYLDAEHYAAQKQAYARAVRGVPRPDYDRALEGVLESRRILLPANRKVEIDRMIHFAAELKQPAILYGMREGFRSTELLQKANLPVLVSLKWPVKEADSDPDEVDSFRTLEDRDKAPSSPAEFQKAHVKYAFYTDGVEQPRDVQRAVKKAMDAGLSREDAVRAMTLSPAEIFGVADRVGSLEPGKIANLMVTRGDVFEERTRLEMVFIDGKKYMPPPETPPVSPAKPVTNTGAKPQ